VRHLPKSEKSTTPACGLFSSETQKGQERMKIEPVSKIQEAPATNTTRDQRPLGPPPTNPIIGLKKILVPVDPSNCCKKALEYASTFAKQFGGELIILHVIEPHPFVPELAAYDFENFHDSCQDLHEFQKFIDKTIPSSVSIRTGTHCDNT
jgi:hypothetical protein